MLAPIASGSTPAQWEVLRWVAAQGEFLTPTPMATLYYLASNAWYRPGNQEEAPVCQVLYQASKYENIMRGTGIRSRMTLRKALNDLQDQAYVYRSERGSWGNHDPLRIMVLWEEPWDLLREGLRAGTRTLPERLLERPSAPEDRRAPVIPLRAVEAQSNSATGTDSVHDGARNCP